MKQLSKINFESKPTVTFNLEPIHINFCRYIFNTPHNQRHILLRRNEDIGKLIFSHIQTGDFRNTRPLINSPVTFILPNPNNDNWIRYRYLFIPKWVESKITDGIDYEFKNWVREKFRIGYEQNWEQKTIVNAILRGLNVRNNAINFDTIKKIDYRNRRKTEEKRFRKLYLAELESD
jgi:hypothetical protein